MDLTISQRQEIAKRAQEKLDAIYNQHGWDGPPDMSPGLVEVVYETIEEVKREAPND